MLQHLPLQLPGIPFCTVYFLSKLKSKDSQKNMMIRILKEYAILVPDGKNVGKKNVR